MGVLCETELDDFLKVLLLKDLRIQCRARGISPAGSRETLLQTLKDNMLQTGDYSLKTSDTANAGTNAAASPPRSGMNNYHRPEGQNVGNFLTERPVSRVLNVPGGSSQIVFGADEISVTKPGDVKKATVEGPDHGTENQSGNNYHRPGGQNVGNFLTDRNSSRVLAPPGGQSQITFG
eukprot:jgi/Botrbrau1/6934/Bobra.0215s0013.1